MIFGEIKTILPKEWSLMDLEHSKYELVPLCPSTLEAATVECNVMGPHIASIDRIYRVQNPFLYTKYFLKMMDYQNKGPLDVMRLYHDTSISNVESICTFNIDWRYGQRYKYGPGVYFSSSPQLANKHSSPYNGEHRAMFLVDVLVGNVQTATQGQFLPDPGFDTVRSMNSATYVKYFDNEFYPTYVVLYYSY